LEKEIMAGNAGELKNSGDLFEMAHDAEIRGKSATIVGKYLDLAIRREVAERS
jgi:hypothetical protein